MNIKCAIMPWWFHFFFRISWGKGHRLWSQCAHHALQYTLWWKYQWCCKLSYKWKAKGVDRWTWETSGYVSLWKQWQKVKSERVSNQISPHQSRSCPSSTGKMMEQIKSLKSVLTNCSLCCFLMKSLFPAPEKRSILC